MHVLLNRRSHRIGLSLQCLLWICFGILAVAPWRYLRGDETAPRVAVEAPDRWSDAEIASQDAINEIVAEEGASDQSPRTPVSLKPISKTQTPSLIFRGQNGPMESGGPAPNPDVGPYQLSPLPSNGPPSDDGFLSNDRVTGRSGQAFGYQIRMSGITGPAIGREHPIFPFELMPYAFSDNNLFFLDVRGFTDTRNGFGGNFGGGYRRYIPAADRIFGVNGYYDYDNTSGSLFRELGFGVESLGAMFDVRANAYFPTGTSRTLTNVLNIDGTQNFSGHNLLVNQQKTFLNALHGFDTEIGFPLPGRVMERHDVRVFGGGYWFEGQAVQSFGGWKTRISANVIPSVALNLQVSNDAQFKTNVVFGATWTFGGYRQSPDERKTQFDRMTTPVQRQYNMVVAQTHELATNVPVVNPTTNQPYFIEHVDSNAAGVGDGTVSNPFKSFVDAQNAASPNNIIFVHANSVYSNLAVALQPDVRVLGESANVEHLVSTTVQNNVSSMGNDLFLPHVSTSPTAARPMFLNSPGVGVTLANNSEFSGFQIGNSAVAGSGPAGIGILGDSITNATVRETTVSFSGGESVFLNKTAGTITFLGDTFNTPTSNANTFHISSTTGTIIVGADPAFISDVKNASGQKVPVPTVINNTTGAGGSALLVEGTKLGSVVNFTGSTINDTNDTSGSAVFIRNDGGAVTLGDANVTNNNGFALNFLNDSGTIIGNGTYTINGSIGDAINIQNLTSTGRVAFTDPGEATPANITISNRLARGINLNNNAGNITFATPVIISSTGTVGVAAIENQGSSGNVTFNVAAAGSNAIDITNGGVGILIGTNATDGLGNPIINTGSFTVNGATHIKNPSDVGIKIFDDHSTVTFNGGPSATTTPMIEQRQNIGIQVLADHGTVNFNGRSTISNDNATPSIFPAVDIRQNSDLASSVTFGTLNVLDPIGPVAAGFGGTGVNIGGTGVDANPASVTINALQITSTNVNAPQSTALFVQNEGQINTTGGPSTGLRILGTTALNPPASLLSSISVTNTQAVNISNSVINVQLNQVSSSNSATTGITLTNNQAFPLAPPVTNLSLLNNYMFEVLGINAAGLRNGGTISGANTAGINITQTGSLAQTGAVSLNQIAVDTNQNDAIDATGLLHLNVNNSDISFNTHNGILATNIPQVDIASSNFSLNGTTINDNAIHLTATQVLPSASQTALGQNPTAGQYIWNVVNNNTAFAGNAAGFTGATGAGNLVQVDSNGKTIEVQTSPTSLVATPLVFNFNNNTALISSGTSANPTSVVAINWTGVESGNVNENTINLSGFNNAISMTNTDPTRYATVTSNYSILGNAISGNNGGNTGILVNNFGPTELNIESFLNTTTNTVAPNTFTFVTPANALTNTGDVAMKFSILNSTTSVASSINIQNNIVTMTGQNSDQGIIFQTIQSPATVTLSGNNISVNTLPNAATIGQGIDFQSILGTINLQGTVSNTVTINGFSTVPNAGGVTTADWVVLPANSATRTGSFFVNGFLVQ